MMPSSTSPITAPGEVKKKMNPRKRRRRASREEWRTISIGGSGRHCGLSRRDRKAKVIETFDERIRQKKGKERKFSLDKPRQRSE